MPHALVIDDNVNNTNVLVELLTLESVSYTVVNNPALLEASLAALSAVSVVFLDLEMPNRDGYEVLELLHHHPLFAGVPIVAYTVHVSHINEARRLGFHSFLAKPLDADQFPEQLARILRGDSVWTAR